VAGEEVERERRKERKKNVRTLPCETLQMFQIDNHLTELRSWDEIAPLHSGRGCAVKSTVPTCTPMNPHECVEIEKKTLTHDQIDD
jgi:hypothetical protein